MLGWFKKRNKAKETEFIEFLRAEEKADALALSAVISAISNISDTVASLPLNLFENKDEHKIIAKNHPLYRLIRFAPNQTMTPYTLFEALVKSMLIYGNAFIYPIRNRKKEVISLEFIDEPSKLSLYKDEKGLYYYLYNAGVRLEYNEVVNIPYHTQDGIKGIAPLRKSKNTAKLASLIENHGLKFFENGAFASGVLEVANRLDTEHYERLKESFASAFSKQNAYKPIILEEGSKFTPVFSANKDSQLLELKQFQVIEIARLFNIPPHKLGDLSRATFSNIEQQETNYMVQTIAPLTTKIEQALNRFLLREDEWGHFYFKFNVNAVLKADISTRWDSYTKALQNGVMCVNEVRELEELNPIENGNIYFQALNMTQMGANNEPQG